jgi:y4mF family transcriptional regulator
VCFRSFIQKRRKEEGLSQRQLAELAGVGLRFVREIEQGKERLRVDKVNAVLKLFGKKLGPVNLYEIR